MGMRSKGTRPLVFVDCETTGLDPSRHEVYEVALTRCDDDGRIEDDRYFWIEPTQLYLADSAALRIGRLYERRPEEPAFNDHLNRKNLGRSYVLGEEQRYQAAMEISEFTAGAHLVGAQPAFDAEFLEAFLRRNGSAPAWHYRKIDVESLAIGVVVGEDQTWGRPLGLESLCEVLSIPRPDAHQARADCEQAQVAYFKLMRMAEEREAIWRRTHG